MVLVLDYNIVIPFCTKTEPGLKKVLAAETKF